MYVDCPECYVKHCARHASDNIAGDIHGDGFTVDNVVYIGELWIPSNIIYRYKECLGFSPWLSEMDFLFLFLLTIYYTMELQDQAHTTKGPWLLCYILISKVGGSLRAYNATLCHCIEIHYPPIYLYDIKRRYFKHRPMLNNLICIY